MTEIDSVSHIIEQAEKAVNNMCQDMSRYRCYNIPLLS
jgi:hypothetical protein